MVGYLDDVIRSLVLIFPKIYGYITNVKNKNNKLISFHIDDNKILENYKSICTRNE